MNEQAEQWLPVVGWEGLYEVSDFGRVRSISRTVERRGEVYEKPGRVLKPIRRTYHFGVSLYADGKSTPRPIHRLVLEAFVGPRPEGMECCHLDDDPTNNRLSNLRWDTHSANQYDQVRNGKHFEASQTSCSNGHEFTPENTRITKRGRECKECQRKRIREYMQRRRAKIAQDDSRCGQCGRPRESDHRLCDACRERICGRSREDRAKRRADKTVCNKCGRQKDSNQFKLCSSCRAYNREIHLKRQK